MIHRVKSGSCFWDYDSIDAALEHLEDAFKYWDEHPLLKELMPTLEYTVRKATLVEIKAEIDFLQSEIKSQEKQLAVGFTDPHIENNYRQSIQTMFEKLAWYKRNSATN